MPTPDCTPRLKRKTSEPQLTNLGVFRATYQVILVNEEPGETGWIRQPVFPCDWGVPAAGWRSLHGGQ